MQVTGDYCYFVFLFQDPIVIMSPQPPLVYDRFSGFPCFNNFDSFVLARYPVECFPIRVYLIFYSWLDLGYGLLGRCRGEVSFRQTISRVHDLSLMINKHLARAVFHRFPHCEVTSPHFPYSTFWKQVIMQSPHSEEDGVRQGLTSTFWSEECLNDVFGMLL